MRKQSWERVKAGRQASRGFCVVTCAISTQVSNAISTQVSKQSFPTEAAAVSWGLACEVHLRACSQCSLRPLSGI